VITMRFQKGRPLLIVMVLFLALLVLGCSGSEKSSGVLKSEERLEGMYEACQSVEISDPAGQHPAIDVNEIAALPRVDVQTKLKRSNGMEYQGTWSGPSLSDVLSRQGIEGDFQELRIVAWDGYVAHVARDVALRPDTILAFEQDGAPIAQENGPVRLVVGSEDGFYWVRMITRIEIVR
jgi:DMSO/TMAO reductase YedYZ molybdopterin-dependent catalytic subunit